MSQECAGLKKYCLPRSLVVEPLAHRRLKGDLEMIFGGGILLCHDYCPGGLNAMWALTGVVASLEQPFAFDIRYRTAPSDPGFTVGFKKGHFCFTGRYSLEGNLDVYTRNAVDLIGSRKVTIESPVWNIFSWVPDRAMMSFEELVKVGNSVLLSRDAHVCTPVSQRFDHWKDNRYRVPEGHSPVGTE
jgi:hypothetical protein